MFMALWFSVSSIVSEHSRLEYEKHIENDSQTMKIFCANIGKLLKHNLFRLSQFYYETGLYTYLHSFCLFRLF